MQNRELTGLKNIGEKIAGRLQEIGVTCEEDLRHTGPVEAHRKIRQRYPDETLPLCYYLYSFEGALTDRHWDRIGEQRKNELRSQIG